MAAPMIPPPAAFDFLARHGWGGAEILPLAGDASFRRYFRVVDGVRTAVLMDAPPAHEDSRPFLAIAAYLESLGLSAPHVLAVDLEKGLILLEDFGDARVNPLLEHEPHLERDIYERAIDLLAELHQAPAGDVPPYDAAVLHREASLLTDWYAPALDLPVDKPRFTAAWNEVFEPVLRDMADRPVLVLRDYHADNLMWLPDRSGIRALGLLDFQDGLAGHPAYDLVSLLQDARRDVSPELETAMIDRYAAAANVKSRDAFRAAYEVLGAQRNTKILGIFTRLWKRDGKPGYLAFQPRVWDYLERDLAASGACPRQVMVRCQFAGRGTRRGMEGKGMSRFRAPLALRPSPVVKVPSTAMVLAAGLGKRMRPLTATRPKPLVEVAGRSLLDRALDRLRGGGIKATIVNVHYLADALEAHLASRPQEMEIRISDERAKLLETGGGVAHALPLIDADPFYVVNSDNLWVDGPVDTLKLLAQRWNGREMDALLLMVPLARANCHGGFGDFHMDPVGRLSRKRTGKVAPFVFTGIQLVSKRLFKNAPEGAFSMNVLWDRAIAEGRCFGVAHQGLWFDVGTPRAVGLTEAFLSHG